MTPVTTVSTGLPECARLRRDRVIRDFAARGALVVPAAPASEVVDFLEADGHPRFSERRLGR